MNFIKEIFGFSFIPACLIIMNHMPLYAMGGKIEIPPIKASVSTVSDKECDDYIMTMNGIDYPLNVVFREEQDKKYGPTFKIYYHILDPDKNESYPSLYTDYESYIIVSLSNGTVLENKFRDIEKIKKNYTDGYSSYLKVDLENEEAYYTQTKWDGNETKVSQSRQKIKRKYPVYDTFTLMLAGIRFLDIHSKGILLMLEPIAVKNPMPFYINILGREKLTTPAGTFNTVKISFSLADPFLGTLLSPYTKNIVYWVEDARRSMLIKVKSPMFDLVLKKTGILN